MASDSDISLQPDQPEQGDAAAQADQHIVNTQGGDYAEGSIDKRQATVVGRDQNNLSGNFPGATINILPGSSAQEPIVDLVSLVERFPPPLLRETYVERDQTSDLIARLTDTKSKRPIRIVLHGFGGQGKTTLIQQIGNTQSVKDHFSDRIFWLPAEELKLDQGKELIDALKRQTFPLSSTGVSPQGLSDKQIPTRMLLFVDNIWTTEEVVLLSEIGSNCAIVMTTREKVVAQVLNAESIEIKKMTLSEATSLLRNEINRGETFIKEGEYQNKLQELAERSEYWPLLINIISGYVLNLIKAKSSVDKALKKVSGYLEAGIKLDEKLSSVVKESLIALNKETNYGSSVSYDYFYCKLSIFPRSTKISLIALKYTFDLPVQIIELMCLRLMNASLINFDIQEEYVQIHDELWKWVRVDVSDKIKIWNQELLNQARNSCRSWGGLILKHQYFSDHISDHLIGSEHVEWVEEIFTDLSSLAAMIKMNGAMVLRSNVERISEAFPSTSDRLKPLIGMINRDRLFLNRCRHHAVETLEAVIYSRIAGQEGFHALDQTWRDHVTKPCLIPIRPINVEQSELIDRRNLGAIVRLCRISADGMIVVAVTDSKLIVWDWANVDDPLDLFELRSGIKPVVCHMSDDGRIIVLLTTDNSIKIWERQDGEQNWRNANVAWIAPRTKLTWCALSANGQVLALIGSGGTVRVYERTGLSWNTEPGKRSSLWATQNQLLECALNQNGTNLIVTSNEKVVRAWDWQDDHWSSAVVFRDIPKSASDISIVPGSQNRIIYKIKQKSLYERVVVAIYSNKKVSSPKPLDQAAGCIPTPA
ncbi:hypothetical protein EYB53_022120, partial [Candidatus Chloroploca sp. M-50]